ncbi:hypothetical protein Y032_0004g1923 [Ancylostoma ceylanicum]|uniref:Uncharacterized protein n=1 Tax=Ancylostoma ceylanicum TaxID=53326 RepID=A0A016VUK4_9BILA|nr:hypothetical protein Y032_0004g1923 [Ancylostoma ceylanicum]
MDTHEQDGDTVSRIASQKERSPALGPSQWDRNDEWLFFYCSFIICGTIETSVGMKNTNPSVKFIEQDLQIILDAIHRLVEIGATLHTWWSHIKGDKCYRASSPVEQLLVISRNLRAAINKECILRLTTQYILTDQLCDNRGHVGRLPLLGREDWLETEREHAVHVQVVLDLVNDSLMSTNVFIGDLERRSDVCHNITRFIERDILQSKLTQIQQIGLLKKTLVDFQTVKGSDVSEPDAHLNKYE